MIRQISNARENRKCFVTLKLSICCAPACQLHREHVGWATSVPVLPRVCSVGGEDRRSGTEAGTPKKVSTNAVRCPEGERWVCPQEGRVRGETVHGASSAVLFEMSSAVGGLLPPPQATLYVSGFPWIRHLTP